MVRRPVAGVVAVVLLAEAVFIAALNWFLGVVVDRQDMSLAGLDPDVMSMSSKIGGVVFGLYFALCALVAALVAVRDRAPAGLGRVLLISAAVVHGLLGAFAWGLVGWTAFLFMVVVLGLIVLLLMTYDRAGGPESAAPGGTPGEGAGPAARAEPGAAPAGAGAPVSRTDEPQDGDDEPQDSVPARIIAPVPTTP
ncbi:hypothetical protein GCM10010300_55620 [Streptomyces olivaceoviridis]|uniref:hypothetical protein n=1 Tax=Streptomyces olivaceoviridis TaxID=1921 RepID=UPI0019BBAAC5|nr:hypothetical protein [Streptomyces olivaceoviridis]GGZ04593.1 hypothetical protein GCM10010300_55620 [Streptomyces olivaceoviridis]